jgi:hypothetical protein
MKSIIKLGIFLYRLLKVAILMLIVAVILGSSDLPKGDEVEQIRAFTRDTEFDYVKWTLDALNIKVNQSSLDLAKFIELPQSQVIISDYIDQVSTVQQLKNQIEMIYADPGVQDPTSTSVLYRDQLVVEESKLFDLSMIAEAILQNQVNATISRMGLSSGGQTLPPIAYHVSELPLNLVTSPRYEIKRIADVSLQPGMTAEEKEVLESSIFNSLDISALVVPVGGIGAYPTMVMQTTNLNWLIDVIAHEWMHNYLTLRPLGINYETSPEMTTINETTASIAGKEISLEVLKAYYPELVPQQNDEESQDSSISATPEPDAFDFRAEMRITRVTVDEMLTQGKIDEAETYMEARRQVFWENGYLIRKLNQAYFVFYGAYNDEPGGGPSGNDPVGPLVQELRNNSTSLEDFITSISLVNSYDELVSLAQSRR